jgi:hypothetical protein
MKIKYLQAIKFYAETRNEEQLKLAYKEFDNLLEIYFNFKWFLKFDLNNLPKEIKDDIINK